MSRILALAAALAILVPVAGSAPAQMHRPGAAPRTMAYLATAGAADLYEIRASQMAVARSSRRDIRAFAQMLVADHNRSTRMVVAAARAAGLRPGAPMLDGSQRRMLDQLGRLRGPAFDRLYLGQQIPAHQQGLALHRDYARGGDVPALRRTASAIVPVVERHLARARQLAR